MLARRRFMQALGLAATALAVGHTQARPAPPAAGAAATLSRRLAAIERAAAGRLGVALRDARGTLLAAHRADERFPMCSTFKFPLAGAVLQRVDRGELALDRPLPIRRADLSEYAPVTGRHVGGHLSVAELCQAAMIWSDNPAANLLLPLVGGPPGVTAFLRGIGDTVTRNDRAEPEVNRHAPGDPRDTTHPAAMAETLRTLLLGEALRPASRQRLTAWMLDNRTGGTCLRAGLPRGWRIGDKTGSDGRDTRNDIAILWPAGGGSPLLLTAYLSGARVDSDARDAALQAVAAAVSEAFPA